MGWVNKVLQGWATKLNPAQESISQRESSASSTASEVGYSQAFNQIEAVNRGVNMIVSACSGLDYDIKDKVLDNTPYKIKQKALVNLINFRPNPYQSVQEFRTHIFTDYILEGNIFIYFDGAYMYHLPAINMEVISHPKTFVDSYMYNSTTRFLPDEIIHIKDISSSSVFRGDSRLRAADKSIKLLNSMKEFQTNFFNNGAIAGIVIETDNTLSQVAKERTIQNWVTKYSVKKGARSPMILDSGLKLKSIGDTNFKDMDFDSSIKTHDIKILLALGVPEVLVYGGNNANITPNLRLFYLETILPIVKKYISALERYFGYDIETIITNVNALQPDLKDIASYHTSLVNGGIITPNEARVELRFDKLDNLDSIRVPANIAGSAVNPDVGGAPTKPKEDAQ
jgi:HK97 family phage portal protein